MFAFVLDDERTPVVALAHEVRIEFARGSLKPKSVFAILREVANPVFDFGASVEKEGAVGLFLVHLSDGLVVVVEVLVVSVVEGAVRVVGVD